MRCVGIMAVRYRVVTEGEFRIPVGELREHLEGCPEHEACQAQRPGREFSEFPVQQIDETCGEHCHEVREWIMKNPRIILQRYDMEDAELADATVRETDEVTIIDIVREIGS